MAALSWIHWPRAVLARWDRLSQERRTLGVLALDAHGGIALTEETDVVFPSHETAFRLGRLHLLPPSHSAVTRQIVPVSTALYESVDTTMPSTASRRLTGSGSRSVSVRYAR